MLGVLSYKKVTERLKQVKVEDIQVLVLNFIFICAFYIFFLNIVFFASMMMYATMLVFGIFSLAYANFYKYYLSGSCNLFD